MDPSTQKTQQHDVERAVGILGLCFILGLAVYFRFANLRANPGWYSDEGVFINYAENLMNGRWQIFALSGSPMLIQRSPLFLFLLAGMFKLWGADILVLRGLAAFYGVMSVLLLYIFARETFGTRLALLSAGVLAICPWVVAYNRIGFTYNQMSPLFIVAVYSCWKFAEKKSTSWAITACPVAGLAFATDYLGVVASLLVGVVFLVYDRRWLLPGALLVGAVLATVLAPAFLASPRGFWGDVSFTFAARTSVSPLFQIINVVLNYGELIRRESWIVLGIVGLFLLPQGRAKSLILFVVGVTVLLAVRTLPPVGRGLHYLLHVFPLVVLGIAAFIARAVPVILDTLESAFDGLASRLWLSGKNAVFDRFWQMGQRVAVSVILFGVLVSPLLWMVFADVAQSVYGNYFIFTGNDDLSLSAEEDVNQVIDFLRSHTTADDLVVASPQIAWAVPSRKADFPLALAYDGKNAGAQPDLPHSRFAYSCSLQQSAYVILDPLARDFATKVLPDMSALIEQVERWQLVFRAGDLEVYKNPLG